MRDGRGHYVRTVETLAKQSASQKGKVLTLEHKAKIQKNSSMFWLGKKLPPEIREKISASKIAAKNGKYIDGLSKHYLEGTHQPMMSRCYHQNVRDYKRYGALGVSVWKHWHNRSSFIFGILALLGDRPAGHTLDRINPHGDYTPDNVRWADARTQKLNHRKRTADYTMQCGEH